MASKEDTKRKRKPNYTSDELEILTREVETHKETLLGKFSDSVTNEKKKKTWCNIAHAMSAVSCITRSGEDVKKKWHDLSSQIKGKYCKLRKHMNMTGGGPAADDEMTQIDQRILSILGNTAVYGLDVSYGDTVPTLEDSNLEENTSGSMECCEVISSDDGGSHSKDIDIPLTQHHKHENSGNCSSTISTKKRKRISHKPMATSSSTSTQDIYSLEEKKLKVDEMRLEVEQSRLNVEEQRLKCEQDILSMLQDMASKSFNSDEIHTLPNTSTLQFMSADYDASYTNL